VGGHAQAKQVAFAEARIEDAKGRLVSRSTGTFSYSGLKRALSREPILTSQSAIRGRGRRVAGISI